MGQSPFISRLIIGMLLMVTAGPALGQEPWPYKKAARAVMGNRATRDLLRNKESAIQGLLRNGGAPTDAQKADISNYYTRHVFAGMTQPEALDSPSRFPDWRKDIARDLERLASNSAARSYIRDDLVFKYLKPMVVNNYHPACRYNATLIIGMLNDREGGRGGAQVVYPTPYADGRSFLIQVVRSKNMPESVRIAALIGLRRHAQLLAANGASGSTMLRALVDIVKAKQPRAGDSAEGFYWQKRLAIEALGSIGPAATATILDPVVQDPNLPMMVRCVAARALGQLDYRGAKNLKSESLIKGLGQIAVTACRNGIQRLRDYDAENPVEANDDSNTFLTREETAAPEADPVVDQTRRRMRFELDCVIAGLAGVEKITSDKTVLNAIKTEIEAIEKGLKDNPETTTAKELIEKIGSPAVQLETTVKNA